MPIATLIPLLIQYGFPFVEKIIALWTSNANVTVDDWNALKALAQNTALSQMEAALSRAGIPQTDPHAAALLAQLGAPPAIAAPAPPASPATPPGTLTT